MADYWVELLGDTLLNAEGEVKTAEALKDKKRVALYFSAHWCPPCRGFTPVLSEFYSNCEGKDLAVIFVSSDRDEAGFKEYFGSMPFLALPYSQRDRKGVLAQKFNVSGIPTLHVFDMAGTQVQIQGRGAVMTWDGDGRPKYQSCEEFLSK